MARPWVGYNVHVVAILMRNQLTVVGFPTLPVTLFLPKQKANGHAKGRVFHINKRAIHKISQTRDSNDWVVLPKPCEFSD